MTTSKVGFVFEGNAVIEWGINYLDWGIVQRIFPSETTLLSKHNPTALPRLLVFLSQQLL